MASQNAMILLFMSLLVDGAHAWMQSNNGASSASRDRRQRPYMAADTNQEASDRDNCTILPRLYVGPNVKLNDGMQFALTPDQAHYVTRVMRIGKKRSREGSIRVFDGINGEWLAQILVEDDVSSTDKRKRRRRDDVDEVSARCTRQLRPQVCEETTNSNALSAPWLFFAPVKKQRIKTMLEKCTELGVGRFVPIVTERVDPSSVRDLQRDWKKLTMQTVEASEQCERLTVPPLSTTCLLESKCDSGDLWDLATLLTEWSTDDARHLLICRERTAGCSVPVLKLLQSLCSDETVTGVAFAIGPEGGWSPAEEVLIEQCTSLSDNIHCVSLGSLVLRAETASITAVGAFMLCQEWYNDDNRITTKS